MLQLSVAAPFTLVDSFLTNCLLAQPPRTSVEVFFIPLANHIIYCYMRLVY